MRFDNNNGFLGIVAVVALVVIIGAVAGFYLLGDSGNDNGNDGSDSKPSEDSLIYTAEDLQNMDPAGEYYLANDIDLSSFNWTSIDNFTGKLHGEGHSIIGLSIESSRSDSPHGFVNTNTGTIENIKFENANIRAPSSGVVAGTNNGFIRDVTVNGEITHLIGSNMGGIAGTNNRGTIENCVNACNIEGSSNIGGIAGVVNSNAKIIGCENIGTIKCSNSAGGGIAGYVYGTLTSCSNSGIIDCSGKNIGGIIGISGEYAEATDLSNTGAVSTDGNYVGGLVGYWYGETSSGINSGSVHGNQYVGGAFGATKGGSKSTVIQDCRIDGKSYVGGYAGWANLNLSSITIDETVYIEGSQNVGGLVGYISGNLTGLTSYATIMTTNTAGNEKIGGIAGEAYNSYIDSCSNYSTLNVRGDYVGGIVGYADHNNWTLNERYSITYCENHAQISVDGEHVGGIAGSAGRHSTVSYHYYLENNLNEGTISGDNYVGGIIGIPTSSVTHVEDTCINLGTISCSGNYYGDLSPSKHE